MAPVSSDHGPLLTKGRIQFDDAPFSSYTQHTVSSFVDTSSLGSLADSSDFRQHYNTDERNKSRIGVVSSSSDTSGARDFDAALRTLAQQNNLGHAIDEAEQVAKSVQWYTPEQVIALWEAGAYLIHNESSPEARRSGSLFLEAVAARQDLSPAARRTVFESILSPSNSDVIPARVQALITLSDHGRRLEFTTSSVFPVISACLVPLYEVISSVRLKARKAKPGKTNGFAYDDAVLDDVLQFVVDLITLQRKPPSGEEVQILLEQLFIICRKTSVAADIKNSLNVPDASFITMLEVLCSIHASVKPLSGPTSRVVRSLVKSKRQVDMVSELYSFLTELFEEKSRNLNVVRGTVYVLTDIIRAHGQDGIPELQFEQLIDCLKAATVKDDGRLEADILDLCLNILEGDFLRVALEKDWGAFVDVMNVCSARAVNEPEQPYPTSPDSQQNTPKGSVVDDAKSSILANAIQIASVLEALWDRLNKQQRLNSTRFLMNACRYIGPPQAELVLDTMRQERFCSPGSENWLLHSQRLIRCFIRSRNKPSDIRILALDTLKESFSNQESLGYFQEKGLLKIVLEKFNEEDDILLLESLVAFLVDIAITVSDNDTFDQLIHALSSPMSKDLEKESLAASESSAISPDRQSFTSVLESSLANVCAAGLVKIFLRTLNMSANKATSVFEALLKIAQSAEWPADSRLACLKLLYRLRCDASGSIIVTSTPEDDFMMQTSGRSFDAGSKPYEDSTSDCSVDNDQGRTISTGRHLPREPSSSILSRSTGRNSIVPFRSSKPTPPVWTFATPQVLPEEPPVEASPYVYAYASANASSPVESDPTQKVALKANMWLETVISLLQRETNWDIYSYVLTHLVAQLQNKDLFSNAVPQIKLLRSVLCDQVKNDSFREPPTSSGTKKTDVAGYIFEFLCALISYHEHFAKSEEDELVRAFMMGIIGSWGGTSRGCIHALSVCCHEIPLSVTKSLNGILDKMSKVTTMSNLAVHILEFLALLARLPEVYVNLRDEDLRTVFGICMRFLQTSRESRLKADSPTRVVSGAARLGSIGSFSSFPESEDGMSRYIYTLTYHVMVFWFLSLKLQDRAKHVNWITSRLIFKDKNGKDSVEEQSQVFIDLMQRAAFSDLGDTIPYSTFPPSPEDGPVSKKSWIVGMSIVTVETAGVSGLTQLTKRQASGTTYAMYQQRTAPVLAHQVSPAPEAHLHSDAMRTAVLPSHVMLQLTTTAFPMPTVMQPILLPDDDMTRRALSSFDRNDIVDGHKIGVLYIENGQTAEAEILSNTGGSPDYEYFLSKLGTKVPLRGARFNTQGLHADFDGDSTYAWRDRVTEIVFHVATMMPTNFDNDPACVNKKRHLGNDFVNIVFNRSNTPFNFNTVPSQFNFVNIVINPTCRVTDEPETSDLKGYNFDNLFYQVKVMSKPGFPEISPAAVPKVISGKNLGAFVRILALNASVLSLVWNSQGGEHVSSWRNRLREIKRLRERTLDLQAQNAEAAEATYPGQRRNTKANIFSEELATPTPPQAVKSDSPVTDWNAATDANFIHNLDFSRWGR
ncbi:putative GTPase activating protein (Tsc2) [Aspergillus homomorphus CBS 101889]|uniref:GTPase activating protein n=1 Tax=Aspergillus homomorphus (strain CBS 101889) TaxID=1450537 RepID=A0A395HKG3_ASPHC|nr:GTPase activating protein [Aspergillus homomorphus CBS 101889]RAL08307.1 GTPase activating protein [Aspergillus homomorphus CBS 101889]